MANAKWKDGDTLDEQMIAAWYRLKPDRKAAGKLLTALSWLRKYPRVFNAVIANDLEAASFAVQNKWDQSHSHAEVKADWQAMTEQQALDKVQAIQTSPMAAPLSLWFAKAVIRHAPQHTPLLPQPWITKAEASIIADANPDA